MLNRGFTVGLVSELLTLGYGHQVLSLAARVVRWSATSHSRVALTTLTRSNTVPLSLIAVFSQKSAERFKYLKLSVGVIT